MFLKTSNEVVLQVDEKEYSLVLCVFRGSEYLGREGTRDQATSAVPPSALSRTYTK